MSRVPSTALMLVHLVGAGLALRTLALSFEFERALRLMLPHGWPWILAATFAAACACLAAAWKAWRRPAVPGICWRMLAYGVVGAWLADVFVWNSVHPLHDCWIATAAAGSHATVCLLAVQRAPYRLRWLRFVDVLAMNVVVLLLLGEAGSRIVAAALPSPLFIAPGSLALDRIAAHRIAPGRVRFGFRNNSWGYFDQEFLPRTQRDRPMVLCIGDSFSVGTVPHARHYTTVAERALGGVDIYSMGILSCGPREYLHLWQHEGEPLQPDLLVVALFIGNDITDASFGLQEVDWHDPQSSMLFRTVRRLWLLRSVNRKATVEGVASDAGASADPSSEEPAWVGDPQLEIPSLSAEEFMRIETTRAGILGRPLSVARFDRFTGLLGDLTASAGSTPLAFVLIPDEFQVEDRLWADILERSSVPLERDLPQSWIRAWFASRGLPCLDLLPALRALRLEADGKRHAYHLQDTHFNARGNRVAGEALAAFLSPLLAKNKPR